MVKSVEALNALPVKQAQPKPKTSTLKIIVQATRATLVLALMTGVAYPLFITAAGQLLFPRQASGSLVKNSKGETVGSTLLAQGFAKPEYFHPRPSAAGSGYAGEASGGTNLGPTSKKLFEGQPDDPATKETNESFDGVSQLASAYRHENSLAPDFLVPVDAVTRSGSGLDPDISLANARIQALRVAKARKMPSQVVLDTISKIAEGRQLGILGEPRVNVFKLNLELDKRTD